MESPDEAESEESDKERSDRTVATEGTLASGSATDKCEENGSADGKSQHSDGMDYMCGLDNCLDPATAKQTEENHVKDSDSAGPFDEEREDQSQASTADKSTEHNKDITLSSSKDIPPPQVVQSESVDPDLSREAETGDQLCQEEVHSVDVVSKQGSDLVVDEGLGVLTKSTISDLDSTSGHNRNNRNNPKELIGRDVEHPRLQSSQSNASNVVAEEDNEFASKDDDQALAPQGNEENLASNKDLREREIDSLSEILNGNPDSEVAADDATSPWTNRGVRIPPSSSCAPNLEPDRSDVSDTASKVDRKPEPKQESGVPHTKSRDSELPTRLGDTDRAIHETNKDSRDPQEYLYPDDEGGDPLSGHLADAEDDLEPSDTKDTLASAPSEEVAGLCGASTCLGDYCGGNGNTIRPDRGNPSAVQTPRSRAASLSPKRIEWNKPISIRASLTNDGGDGKSPSQPGTPTVNQFVFGKTVVTVKVRVDRPDTSPSGNADQQLIVHTPQSLQSEQVENGKRAPESNPAVQTGESDGLGSRQFAREPRKEEMVSEDKKMSLVVKSSLEEQSEERERKMANCQRDATVNETEPTTGDGVTPLEEPQQSIDSTELAAEILTESSSAEVELLCVPSKSQSHEEPEPTALQQHDERVLVPSSPPQVENADTADNVENTNDVVKAVEEGAHDSESVPATVSRTSSHQVVEADAIDTCAIEAGAIEASGDDLVRAENKDDTGSPALDDNDDLSIQSTEVLVLGNGSIKTREDGHCKLSVIDYAEKSPSVDDNDKQQTNQVGSVAVAAATRSPAAFPHSPSSKSRTLSILLDDEELSMESRNDELLEDRVAGHAYHRCGDSVECETDRKEEEGEAVDGACIECGDAKEGQGPATASDTETPWAPDMSVPLFVEITFTKKRSFFCSQFMEDVYDGCNRLCGVDDLTTNSSGRDEAPTAREGAEGERISL